MEKEFNYTFKKMYPYVETSVLKQKDANSILTLVKIGRLKNLIEFEGYGVCEYDEDDKQQINAHVTLMDKFNRLRTNVLVFDVFDNDWTNGVYDKLFIFKTNWVKEPTFNIVFVNTKTGACIHHPEIEFAYDILIQDITKIFNTVHKKEIFDFYANKIKCSRTTGFNDLAKETNLEPIMERYRNAKWGKKNDNFDEDSALAV